MNIGFKAENAFLAAGQDAATREIESLEHSRRPSTRHRPRLSIDGDQWCALYGDNLQDGVAGFGKSPELAYRDFDRAWHEVKP